MLFLADKYYIDIAKITTAPSLVPRRLVCGFEWHVGPNIARLRAQRQMKIAKESEINVHWATLGVRLSAFVYHSH